MHVHGSAYKVRNVLSDQTWIITLNLQQIH